MYSECRNAKVFYEAHGEGEPLVLIAGFGASGGYWNRAPACLPGYKVITLDNRGVGRTEYEGHFGIDDLGDDVIRIMDDLGVSRTHLLGWSMGSHIARNVVARYPERIADLALVGTYLDRPSRSRYVLDSAARMVASGEMPLKAFYVMINSFCFSEMAFKRFEDSDREPPIPKEPQDPKGLLDQLESIMLSDESSKADEITVPTILFHGDEDIMVPPIEGRKVADMIPGSELVILESQGHSIPISVYADRLMKFMRRHPIG